MEYHEIELKDGQYAFVTIPGTQAQTATNYGYVFTAKNPIEILRVTEKHEIAGTDAGSVTLDVRKVPNGSAISAGASILTSTFNLKSTANTAVNKEGFNLSTSRILKENESIGLIVSGVLTSLQGVHLSIYYKTANNGSYR